MAGAITPGKRLRAGRINQDCIQVHQAMIYDRGGERRLWQLVDVADVQWHRELNGLSTAQITVTGDACLAQADVLGLIEPRRHELVLFRNGDRVWEGPIVQVAWFRDRATLLAHDVMEYLKYTPLSKAWPNEDGGGPPLMLDRTAEILEYELTTPYVMTVGTGSAAHEVTVPRWESLDPPANILPHLEVRHGAVLTRSSTEAFEMTVFEHVQNLARSGMDYTVIGRKILFWDRKDTIGRTRTLTDNDFYGDIEIFAAGSDHWSIQHVVAQPSDVPAEYEPEALEDEAVWTLARTNLFPDPRAYALEGSPPQPHWGAYPATHTLSHHVDPVDAQWRTRSTRIATGDGRAIEIKAPMQSGTEYRLRVKVRASVAIDPLKISLRADVASSPTGVDLATLALPAGETEIEVSGAFFQAAVNPAFVMNTVFDPVGTTLDFRLVLIQETPPAYGGYFDGFTPADETHRYSWTGQSDNSPSIEEVTPGESSTALAVGNAGGEHPYYGVWTHITTSENEEGTSEPTQNELNSQAGRGLVGRTPVPVEIRVPTGGGIRPSFDLTIADLIPGVEVPVLATLNLRRVSQMQRIETVTVTETSESEEVGVKMVPYGDVTGVDTL